MDSSSDRKSCYFCGATLHIFANQCSKCGTATAKGESSWMFITSLVMGILLLAILDGSHWDIDEVVECAVMAGASMTFGIVSLSMEKPGKGIAIASVVMNVLALLTLLGLLARSLLQGDA
jgi:hypothetical protein